VRRYLLPLAVIGVLYGANRFLLIPASTGALHTVASCWLNDFLAGGAMVCVLNGALTLAHRPPVTRLLPLTAYLLACGLFWEVVTPLYLPRSVSDPIDVLAVCLAGLLFLKEK